jgi:hypothetical protein
MGSVFERYSAQVDVAKMRRCDRGEELQGKRLVAERKGRRRAVSVQKATRRTLSVFEAKGQKHDGQRPRSGVAPTH